MSVSFNGRLTVSIEEAAQLLGIAKQTLYNQVSAGRCPVPTIKLGGRRLVRVADLIELTGKTPEVEPPASLRKSMRRCAR